MNRKRIQYSYEGFLGLICASLSKDMSMVPFLAAEVLCEMYQCG